MCLMVFNKCLNLIVFFKSRMSHWGQKIYFITETWELFNPMSARVCFIWKPEYVPEQKHFGETTFPEVIIAFPISSNGWQFIYQSTMRMIHPLCVWAYGQYCLALVGENSVKQLRLITWQKGMSQLQVKELKDKFKTNFTSYCIQYLIIFVQFTRQLF